MEKSLYITGNVYDLTIYRYLMECKETIPHEAYVDLLDRILEELEERNDSKT